MNLTKTQIKDILWHGGKALLCAIQLWLLDITAKGSAGSLLSFLLLERIVVGDSLLFSVLFSLIRPVVTVIMFVVLWHYYDTIDDRSFNRFCEVYKGQTETPNVLRDPAYAVGLGVTALGAAPVIASALIPSLDYTGMRQGETVAVSGAIALLLVVGISLLRIRRRAALWIIQKDLRTGNEKTKGARHVTKRIIYAVIYFVALYLLVLLGLSSLLPVWGSFFLGLVKLLIRPAGTVFLILLFPIFAVTAIRRLTARHKFMKRLESLKARGELSYTVHGHPYLSAIFNKVFFGLTITDAPHPDSRGTRGNRGNRGKKDATYTVGIISCFFRKGTIVLCENNVYRFMYAMRLRGIGAFGSGGIAVTTARIVSVPAGSWYTNHGFEFPAGDGERILLIDPTPHVLAIHGHRDDELIEQDNASQLFGYTVYGKNSFLNMLERT